jgi:hypothetical protein
MNSRAFRHGPRRTFWTFWAGGASGGFRAQRDKWLFFEFLHHQKAARHIGPCARRSICSGRLRHGRARVRLGVASALGDDCPNLSPKKGRVRSGAVGTDRRTDRRLGPTHTRVRARLGVARNRAHIRAMRTPTGWDPFTGQWKWGQPSPQVPWKARRKDRPRCGARCRSKHGAPCVARVWQRPDGTLATRCRMHGGTSTGARTSEGRDRLAEAGRRGARERWRRWREARERAAEGQRGAVSDT